MDVFTKKEFQSCVERGKYSVNPCWSSDPVLLKLALQLWHQPVVQEIFASEQPSLKDLEDSQAYYLDNIDVILKENYTVRLILSIQ